MKTIQELANVLDAMEDGIYITREDYTVEFMNRAMIERFGEGVGKKCYQVINGGEVMCPWCQAREVFENGESTHSEVYMPRLDRTYRIIEVPIKNLDGSLSKLNIYRDITKRRGSGAEAALHRTELPTPFRECCRRGLCQLQGGALSRCQSGPDGDARL